MYPSLTTFPGDVFAEFDALQRTLGRLMGLDEGPGSIRASARGAFPALNMGTTDEAVEIYAFAPGLDPATIDVSVERGLLTISGERRSGVADEKTHAYARERFTGKFRRSVSLPEDVDATRVAATYRDGVLKVVMPKLESARPRRIEVKELSKLEHKA